jgi:hypothetical protein
MQVQDSRGCRAVGVARRTGNLIPGREVPWRCPLGCAKNPNAGDPGPDRPPRAQPLPGVYRQELVVVTTLNPKLCLLAFLP